MRGILQLLIDHKRSRDHKNGNDKLKYQQRLPEQDRPVHIPHITFKRRNGFEPG